MEMRRKNKGSKSERLGTNGFMNQQHNINIKTQTVDGEGEGL